jgi:hypothetical protein
MLRNETTPALTVNPPRVSRETDFLVQGRRLIVRTLIRNEAFFQGVRALPYEVGTVRSLVVEDCAGGCDCQE